MPIVAAARWYCRAVGLQQQQADINHVIACKQHRTFIEIESQQLSRPEGLVEEQRRRVNMVAPIWCSQ